MRRRASADHILGPLVHQGPPLFEREWDCAEEGIPAYPTLYKFRAKRRSRISGLAKYDG